MAERGDIVVLGGGPAGLAAALAAARDGATVTLVESADHVGGLCRTLTEDGCRFDLGGHIPFIHDAARVAWAEHLMDSPIPEAPNDLVVDDGTAAGELGSHIGAGFRDHVVRPYMEKVDGWPLEVISADRSRKLRDEQQAPEG